MKLNKDVLQIIFDNLDIKSQLQFRSTSRELRNKFQITDLYNIPNEIAEKINDNVLSFYPNLHLLDASNNPNITDNGVKHLRLHTLNANVRFYNNYSVDTDSIALFNKHKNYNNRISNEAIINMPLKRLFASNNISITDHAIKQLPNLILLDASYNEMITDEGIKGLKNIIELRANGNSEITDKGVCDLITLQVLEVNSNRSVTDKGLEKLQLKKLCACWNINVTDNGIKHMNLKVLEASHNCNILIKI